MSRNSVRHGHGPGDTDARDNWQRPLRQWHTRCLQHDADFILVIESRVAIAVEMCTNGGRNRPLELLDRTKLLIETQFLRNVEADVDEGQAALERNETSAPCEMSSPAMFKIICGESSLMAIFSNAEQERDKRSSRSTGIGAMGHKESTGTPKFRKTRLPS